MDKRLKVAISAIEQAGSYLKEQFLKRHRVSEKKDKSVLLDEDIKSEEIILSTISKEFPTDSFLTEEIETELKTDDIWVIDPLCGSYSYLRGVETWSISVAFISEGEYLLGVVFQPYSNNLFYGENDNHVFMNNQIVHPSSVEEVSEAFISIEHRVFNDHKEKLDKLIKDMKRLRVGHGSGGELSYVAAGFIDAVIKTEQSLMHFAGGRALVEISGGIFIDFSGKKAPTYYNRDKKIDYIACSNIRLAENILTYLQ